MATGLEMVDAFYPGHDPIDYYGQGGFRFGSYSHQGSLMFLPSGTRRWDIASPKEMTKEAFEHVFKEAEEIEILLIGSGTHLVPVNPELKAMFREHGIMADVMDTGAAVRTLNILLAEERAVAAAMLAVD
ncbi:MAG: MTH938/NDUFAF3 family protein [Cohaesibacter sp.]|nr:MTH938/NDUFAF3 family protein [Cohaesibacter sp.]